VQNIEAIGRCYLKWQAQLSPAGLRQVKVKGEVDFAAWGLSEQAGPQLGRTATRATFCCSIRMIETSWHLPLLCTVWPTLATSQARLLLLWQQRCKLRSHVGSRTVFKHTQQLQEGLAATAAMPVGRGLWDQTMKTLKLWNEARGSSECCIKHAAEERKQEGPRQHQRRADWETGSFISNDGACYEAVAVIRPAAAAGLRGPPQPVG